MSISKSIRYLKFNSHNNDNILLDNYPVRDIYYLHRDSMETLRVQTYPQIETSALPTVTNAIKQSLDEMFSKQQFKDRNILVICELLGDIGKQLSPDQITDIVSEMQYLTECWLDDFEREIFKGITLKELLHEKGGL